MLAWSVTPAVEHGGTIRITSHFVLDKKCLGANVSVARLGAVVDLLCRNPTMSHPGIVGVKR